MRCCVISTACRRFLRCEMTDGAGAPGALLDDRLTVSCKDGAIRILELQRAGKAPMKASEFLRGKPLKPPMRLT
jgi:methionyl-tRNA formyltransferase